eukprot:713921-Pyramimonas_sp.AAC.1
MRQICRYRGGRRLPDLPKITGKENLLEFGDTLQARAEIKSGGAAGADGIPTDIYKILPFLGVARVHQ